MVGKSNMLIERALFEASAGIDDSPTRIAFLTQACGGDETMFTRVSSWVEVQEAADAFFLNASLARAEVSEKVVDSLDDQPAQLEHRQPLDADDPGSRIGRYRMLERIGDGGCGVVYLAEQSEPVRRTVAVKIIRRGLDTESVIARFEAERQSLALMDHPNIARVYDAGATEGGRPYFVMELVHGEKITHHCDANHLDVKARLRLMIKVCNAIQHAHQKGVIHRDIKPSNILVTTQDGQFSPKVIDFGIARAVEGGFSDDTRITGHAQVIGTPAYMSPEQASGSLNLDTRGDIYSLGVLLYELLAGRPPFDAKRLAEAGMFEMMRILKDEEPPDPSVMLSRLDAATIAHVATQRSTDPKALISQVRGDLNRIIRKALAKDCKDRYATVAGLAADLRHYLNDEPISVRPPGRLYLLTKMMRRNKLAFTAAAAILLTLFTAFATSSWFYFRERDARKLAEAAKANETRLLAQSKAREMISAASLLLAEGSMDKADKLLANIPFSSIEPTSEALYVFRSYGDWNAIRHRWAQAADCYDLLLKGNGLARMPQGDVQWVIMAIGATHVEAGKHDAYEQFRNYCIANYGSSKSYMFSAIVLKSCLLSPARPETLVALQPLADMVAATLNAADEKSIDPSQFAFAAMSMALTEYRKGNFAEALDWGQRCLEYPDSNSARSVTTHAIRALAYMKLGNVRLACAELAQARDLRAQIEGQEPVIYRGKGHGYWQDCAIARIMLKEAEDALPRTAPR